MNIIFLGTPDFALKPLEAIFNSKHKIVAVVCNHDKPAGRGKQLCPPPTKVFANKHNIKVLQYKSIRKEGVDDLRALDADIMVTCAFGQILSREILDICPFGCLNIHGSLLPKYRGPAPVQWAIANGETETGVTIMKTDEGVDTGDILISETVQIGRKTSDEVFDELSELGANLILKALSLVENKTAVFTKQDHSQMTYFPMIKKDTFKLDFSQPCKLIDAVVRGAQSWPVAFFMLGGEPIKVFEVAFEEKSCDGEIGEVVDASSRRGLFIKVQDGIVEIKRLQAPNGKVLDSKAFLNGRKIEVGTILD